MAGRPIWKGYLRLSLVSVPVRAYTGTEASAGPPHLNQLHAEEDCHRRIRYQKVCPVHGEVREDEIVMGFEYAKDRYVTVTEDEIASLRTQSEKTVVIDAFVKSSVVDPLFLRGKTYYLVPDGRAGDRPYALLERAMREADKQAIGQVTLFRREQLVLIRPLDGLLLMSPLYYDAEIRKPEEYRDEAPTESGSADELKLTKMLIDAATPKKFHLSSYADPAASRLKELVEAKVAGKEIVAPATEEDAPVINIMDALKASMERMNEARSAASETGKKPRTKGPRKASRKVS